MVPEARVGYYIYHVTNILIMCLMFNVATVQEIHGAFKCQTSYKDVLHLMWPYI